MTRAPRQLHHARGTLRRTSIGHPRMTGTGRLLYRAPHQSAPSTLPGQGCRFGSRQRKQNRWRTAESCAPQEGVPGQERTIMSRVCSDSFSWRAPKNWGTGPRTLFTWSGKQFYSSFKPPTPGDNVTHSKSNTEFVVKPVPSGGGPSEFRQSMTPHPLVHQELPHAPHFGIYNRRLRSLEYGNARTEDLY